MSRAKYITFWIGPSGISSAVLSLRKLNLLTLYELRYSRLAIIGQTDGERTECPKHSVA